ncbi:MAG: peptidylprolyl isomerase [Geminicoccaceae bacterium]|nr:peptidylprolyl isomerase [Geminicoccaceae bacterium]
MPLPPIRRSAGRLIAPLLALLLTFTGTAALAQDRIAAVVNDDIVSARELAERIDMAILFSGLPADDATRRRLAPQVFRRMIDERLQMQEARRLNQVAGAEEVERAIASLGSNNDMTADQLRQAVERNGIPAARLEEQVRAELSWLKLVRRQLAPRVVVTDQQLDLALDAQAGGGQEELLLSEIILPVYDPEAEREVVAEARSLMEAIREGADFAKLAREVSVGAAADEGGDLGWVATNGITPNMRAAIDGLQPGQLSDPVRSPAGVHLYLVRDRRIGDGIAGDTDARQLSQLFFPLPSDAPQAVVAQATAQAEAVRPRLASCADVDALAEQVGAPSSGNLGWLRPDELPPDLAAIVGNLKINEISRPVRSPAGIHLLMVCAEGGDDNDAARRAQLREAIENEQVQRLANRYLRDLRKDAFIDVRVQF